MDSSPALAVTLTPASRAEAPVLERLLQLYLHDFSDFAGPATQHGLLGEDGRFEYEYLDLYWQEDGRVPFLIRVNGHLAGFVLVNRWSAANLPLDQAVAEFFVARKYRRHGVGSRAAMAVFSRFPGQWEIPVASYNVPALRFWRGVAVKAGLAGLQEHAGDGQRWSGTILRGTAPGSRGQRPRE